MGSRILALAILLGGAFVVIGEGAASTDEEHRRLTGEAFTNVLTAIGGTTTDSTITIPLADGDDLEMPALIWRDLEFPAAAAHFARDDRARSRFHRRGQTVQVQLGALTAADLETAWRVLTEIPLADGPLSAPRVDVVTNDGVVANFWRYHWLAMRYAGMAAEHPAQREALIRRGLVLEAVALGFLGDAFTAGHLMPADSGWLSFLHPHNTHRLHDSYTNSGVYVIDSRHQVWQTFGDGLLYWYPQSMVRVLAASEVSLREFFASFYANMPPGEMPPELVAWLAAEYPGQDSGELIARWLEAEEGPQYYREMHLASLVRLPMPIAATWSVRSGVADTNGIRVREQYLQTRELGNFDPTLTSHEYDALYSRSDLPDWMRLSRLDEKSPEQIIRFDEEVAAPIFVQEWDKDPSIMGAIVTGGVGRLSAGGESSLYAAYGVGIGLSDELMHVQYLPNFTQAFLQVNLKDEIDGNAQMLSGSLVMQLHLPKLAHLHLETGVTKGVRGALKRAGPQLSVGATSRTVTLPGLYVGARLRVRYEASFLEEISHGVLVEVVVF